jgi:membrane protease YdiL (CAAX protease family)
MGTFGWQWPSPQYLRVAYFLPLLYAAPVYLSVWLVIPGAFAMRSYEVAMAGAYGLDRWPGLGTFGVAMPLLFTITVISTCTWALGEELGWRGFLLPRLYDRFGFHGACLITGLLHAVWHFPILLWSDYNVGTNPVYAIVCFTVGVTAFGYIMGFLRLRSASIWPCVLLHATHNSFVEGIFDPLTAPVGHAKYITSEFGAGLAIAIVIAAMLVVRPSKLIKANVLARRESFEEREK